MYIWGICFASVIDQIGGLDARNKSISINNVNAYGYYVCAIKRNRVFIPTYGHVRKQFALYLDNNIDLSLLST